MSRSAQLRENLTQACLRRATSEREPPHTYYDAELEYCDDMIDAYAISLAAAIAEEERKGAPL